MFRCAQKPGLFSQLLCQGILQFFCYQLELGREQRFALQANDMRSRRDSGMDAHFLQGLEKSKKQTPLITNLGLETCFTSLLLCTSNFTQHRKPIRSIELSFRWKRPGSCWKTLLLFIRWFACHLHLIELILNERFWFPSLRVMTQIAWKLYELIGNGKWDRAQSRRLMFYILVREPRIWAWWFHQPSCNGSSAVWRVTSQRWKMMILILHKISFAFFGTTPDCFPEQKNLLESPLPLAVYGADLQGTSLEYWMFGDL